MARSIKELEDREKETCEVWAGWRARWREAREEGTAFATIYKNTERVAWKAWKEAEADLKWEEFKVAAAKALKPDEENFILCSRNEWEEMEEAAVEWKAAKEWTSTGEVETWEAREEALEALKAEQEAEDETWSEFCEIHDLTHLDQ